MITPVEPAASTGTKAGLFRAPDGGNLLITFALVTSLFLLWGFCNGMIDILNKHFQDCARTGLASHLPRSPQRSDSCGHIRVRCFPTRRRGRHRCRIDQPAARRHKFSRRGKGLGRAPTGRDDKGRGRVPPLTQGGPREARLFRVFNRFTREGFTKWRNQLLDQTREAHKGRLVEVLLQEIAEDPDLKAAGLLRDATCDCVRTTSFSSPPASGLSAPNSPATS